MQESLVARETERHPIWSHQLGKNTCEQICCIGWSSCRFEGQVKPEVGQAAYIVFCAVLGLASAGLVLSIAVPAIGARDVIAALPTSRSRADSPSGLHLLLLQAAEL